MLALRHFKALCCFGVFLGGLSFLFAIVAIATTPWFEAEDANEPQLGVDTTLFAQLTSELDNFKDENTTDDNVDTFNDTFTTTSSNIVTTSTANTVFSLSGLWHICYQKHEIESSARNQECFKTLKIIERMDKSKLTYFQSLIAFELISSIATLTGCLVALIALVQQQPLAVLVAGFTMLFSGMFMLVGHLMMLAQHMEDERATNIDWEYGYSFKLAWTSFTLCLLTAIIDFIVYRNFRKITEEMMLGTVPASNSKYVTRSSPVNIQSSI